MSSKAKFEDSYEMQLVNEFILSLLYFAFSYQGVTAGAVVVVALGAMAVNEGKTSLIVLI